MADIYIRDIFEKSIDRPIDGVIRAGDTSHLATEVDEYVLTNEGEKHLTRVLEEVNGYDNANGIWISGFFGSGKSHMLKMLAFLLGEQPTAQLTREYVATSFADKTDDEFLRGLISKAAAIPATSILFNIAEQVSDKGQGDAILRAFIRTFNEARGYEGKLPYVARFEHDLAKAGQLEAFKTAFHDLSGSDWESKRDMRIYADQFAGKAFAIVNNERDAPIDVLAKYQAMPPLTIADFASEVQEWLEVQGPTHRLSFFVDEIGQFIGGNVGLMLDLQTIAEALNSTSRGRAWVFVTSQEDMERVVGVQSKEQANDFSKIRDRFRTRVNLTSYDVAEVIRKRLLQKTRAAEDEIDTIYEEEKANFKAFFDFEGGGKSYRNYTGAAQFIDTYPFVDYQFTLFHQAMIGLSEHNVFEGRHAAVGERSMLAATQQVATTMTSKRLGALATFDKFYDGLEADIKAAAKGQIELASRNLNDEFGVRVLKALFLVKFVEGFNGTIRNLSVLLFDAFNRSIPELKIRIKASLDKLEAQTYVQRNGDVYEYLTNDEQVMESEIKNVNVDSGDVLVHLYKLLSQDVVKSNKFDFKKSGQDFNFGWMIDDQTHGAQRAITVHVITPLNPADTQALRMQSAGKYELRVILAADKQLIPDLTLFLKTDKYVKQKNSPTLSAIESAMLQIRSQFNLARGRELVERLRKAVGAADLVVNAQDVSSSSQDAVGRVDDGLQALVPHVYPSLNILGGVHYLESDVAKFAVGDGDKLISEDGGSKLEPVATEVLSRIMLVKSQVGQSTTRTLVDHFEARPYGWPMAATLCATARLVMTGRVTASLDGNVLKSSELVTALKNTTSQFKTVLTEAIVVPAAQVQRLRTFCSDFFDEGDTPPDAFDLAKHVADRLQTELAKLTTLRHGSDYPFLAQLDSAISLLAEAVKKPADWYFDEFARHESGLIEARSDVIAPIEQLLNGGQIAIYQNARQVLAAQAANLAFAPSELVTAVQDGLNDPAVFRGKKLPHLKTDTDALQSAIDVALAEARAKANASVAKRIELIHSMSNYSGVEEALRTKVEEIVAGIRSRIDRGALVAVIQQASRDFESVGVPRIIEILSPPNTPAKAPISIRSVHVNHGLIVIDSAESLDTYIDAVRTALQAKLNDGDRITI